MIWGGRLAPEWVAGINRNGWPASPGIAGRNRPEYAYWQEILNTLKSTYFFGQSHFFNLIDIVIGVMLWMIFFYTF